ncbi:unnamed protein product [Linum trigynum]|uniref:Uncharacterized protein n=1 Tax=Linum trigynum TaxID=586398 RepID=A0AAV2CX55_9ROSI
MATNSVMLVVAVTTVSVVSVFYLKVDLPSELDDDFQIRLLPTPTSGRLPLGWIDSSSSRFQISVNPISPIAEGHGGCGSGSDGAGSRTWCLRWLVFL